MNTRSWVMALLQVGVLLQAPNVLAIKWGQSNDPGNIAINSGHTFASVGTWASYDGNCGPDAYLKSSGGCNHVNKSATRWQCSGTSSVSADITMNAGGTTACVITFEADNSSGQYQIKTSTIKVTQLIRWVDYPSNIPSSPSSGNGASLPERPIGTQVDLIAEGTTADATAANRVVTATIVDTDLSFAVVAGYESVCVATEWGAITAKAEGVCRIEATANPDPDELNIITKKDYKEWFFYWPDSDGDGHKDNHDICPNNADPNQTDTDGNGRGDACNNEDIYDYDRDEYESGYDNCPAIANPNQIDSDASGIGDKCNDNIDSDMDEIENRTDNCPNTWNFDQADIITDPITGQVAGNGIGDLCDIDTDGDGIRNPSDNCPEDANAGQADANGDGVGDICASDVDGDGVDDTLDNCPLALPSGYNPNQNDVDTDGIGDVCELDSDSDGVKDDNGNEKDNCALIANSNQADSNYNKIGDACEMVFVVPGGAGSADCSSWADACGDIQGAINLAEGNAMSQVFIAKGLYAITTPIQLKAGIHLIGGFDGVAAEVAANQANPLQNVTILSADVSADDILTDGLIADIAAKQGNNNSDRLVEANVLGVTSADGVRLSGLTFNGAGDTTPINGSALYINGSKVDVINSRFIANDADRGVLFAVGGAEVSIIISQFHKNKANYAAVEVSGAGSKLTISRSTLQNNAGGALSANGASLIVDDVVVSDNTATEGAGIIVSGAAAQVDVTESSFERNVATADGGAIKIIDAARVNVVTTLFKNNHAANNGGAVATDIASNPASELLLAQNSLLFNTTALRGGAVHLNAGGLVNFDNNTFAYNKAGAKADGSVEAAVGVAGGAVDADSSSAVITLRHNTLLGNEANSHNYGGGALSINQDATAKYHLFANLIVANAANTGANVLVASSGIDNTQNKFVSLSGGYNLVGLATQSGIIPTSAWNLSADNSFVASATAVEEIVELTPSQATGDKYGSDLPLLPIVGGGEARNAIPEAACLLDVDQRGEKRPDVKDQLCDIGAYEFTVLTCAEDAQRRFDQGELFVKSCAEDLEGFELNLGALSYMWLMLLGLLVVGRGSSVKK